MLLISLTTDITNFSGTWAGQCDGDNVRLELVQTEDKLTWKDYVDGELESTIVFLINKFNVNQTASTNKITADIAYSHIYSQSNSAVLLYFDTFISENNNLSSIGYGDMALNIERQDNILKVSGFSPDSSTCLLHKS